MKHYLLLITTAFVLSCNNISNSSEQNAAANMDGESLFRSQCANCHHYSEDRVGPALQGASTRWKDKTLLYEFIRNSQGVISENEYAASLYKKYHSIMPDFPNLTDAQIKKILSHCDSSNATKN